MADPTPSPFSDFALSPALQLALGELGFQAATPIQAAALPPLLEGHDLVGRARTGSGKTAAFGLPMLQRLSEPGPRGTRGLILAPTRELALQVTGALRGFATHLDLPIVTLYGGSAYGPQLRALSRGVPIVVGTPGRVIDHLERGTLDLSTVETVVLDEADEMLQMGFIDAVEQILAATPDDRQLVLLSATMPKAIRRIAERFTHEPVTLEVEDGDGPSTGHIDQRWVRVPDRFKTEALVRLLRGEQRGATLVFCRTKIGCQEVADALNQDGIPADAMHGDLAQRGREAVLARLRAGRCDVVVATDVAARGIDVEGITHVVNYDLPDNAEVYAHRIGRTGRAGREGSAIALVTPRQIRKFGFWQRSLKTPIQEVRLPTDADIAARLRAALRAELEGATQGDGARAWLAELAEAGLTAEEVATAALALLADERGFSFEEQADAELPYWARPRPKKERRDDRRDDRRGPDRGRGPRDDRPRGRDDRPRRDERPRHDGPPRRPRHEDADHVEVFVAIGRNLGIRPGDLVGAIAGDANIPGKVIGRIAVLDRKSFVSMPKEYADRLLAEHDHLTVRGKHARIDRSQGPAGPPRPDGPRRDGPRRDDRPFGGKGGSGKPYGKGGYGKGGYGKPYGKGGPGKGGPGKGKGSWGKPGKGGSWGKPGKGGHRKGPGGPPDRGRRDDD